MMRKLIIAALAASAVSAGAQAADLPSQITKASPNPLFTGYPYAASGFYYGLNTMAAGGSADVSAAGNSGVNVNSLTTAQASIGGTLGYVWATPNVFYAVEGIFDWTNLNGASQGFSFTGPAAFEQRVKIGTPLANVLSLLPNNPFANITVPPFPALANGQTATNIHPYLMGGIHEDDVSLNYGLQSNSVWAISPSVGLGMMGQLTNGIAIDTWAETQFQQNEVCVGGGIVCAKESTKYIVGFGIYY